MATGLPGGIGIPHARSAAITEPSLVFGRSTDGIDWGAKDGPATLVFLIAAPEGGGDAHMQMLPKLARALMKKDFKAALAAATTEAEVVAHRRGARSRSTSPGRRRPLPPHAAAATSSAADAGAAPAAAAPAAAAATATAVDDGPRSLTLVGVTSCPTGIAHTYMAAERLENAAKAAGHVDEGRDPGLGRHHAAQRRRDRRRRRRDLRPRPPGQGRRPVRRQADRRRRRQEGHLRRPGPHRGGRAHRRPVEGPPAARGRGDVAPARRCRAACHEGRQRRQHAAPSCASG